MRSASRSQLRRLACLPSAGSHRACLRPIARFVLRREPEVEPVVRGLLPVVATLRYPPGTCLAENTDSPDGFCSKENRSEGTESTAPTARTRRELLVLPPYPAPTLR